MCINLYIICVRNGQVESRNHGYLDGVENGPLLEHEEPPSAGGAVGGVENDSNERAGNDEVSNASIYLDLENGSEITDVDSSSVVSGETGDEGPNRRHRRTEVELLGANVCKETLRSGRPRDFK